MGVTVQVAIHEAKARLSEFIQAALAGEAVVIADRRVVGQTGPFAVWPVSIGRLEGKLSLPADEFFAPLVEDEVAEWE
jgi:hypothetical protein